MLHVVPYQPSLHPFKQDPSCPLQKLRPEEANPQLGLQFKSQFGPYFPTGHPSHLPVIWLQTVQPEHSSLHVVPYLPATQPLEHSPVVELQALSLQLSLQRVAQLSP